MTTTMATVLHSQSKSRMSLVIEWQVVVDDKFYELGPRTTAHDEVVLVGSCPACPSG